MDILKAIFNKQVLGAILLIVATVAGAFNAVGVKDAACKGATMLEVTIEACEK